MVNKVHKMKVAVVKAEEGRKNDPITTGKAGLVLAQNTANHLRLWSDAKKEIPKRKDPSQGYDTVSVVASLVHGLLSGGKGYQATEPMREDAPLLKILGMNRIPSASTVEEVVKYLGDHEDGHAGIIRTIHRFVRRGINLGKLNELKQAEGFIPFWADGSLLEVTGKNFDSIKKMKKERGQMCVGAFLGRWLLGITIANEGEGEETVARRFVKEGMRKVIRPMNIAKDVLILLDSLYGDEPTFEMLEKMKEKPFHIVGVNGLSKASDDMANLHDIHWKRAKSQETKDRILVEVSQKWLQCNEWKKKRTMICLRFKKKHEMIWNYSGVVTNVSADDPRIQAIMERHKFSYEEAIWHLYSKKQGLEIQWKELLRDMGLHNPPCAKAKVNAVFYAIAGLAYNLSVAIRTFTLPGKLKRMQLWRLRREIFDLSGYVVKHAGNVITRLTDAKKYWVNKTLTAMNVLLQL